MFKLFQNLIGGESEKYTNINEDSRESLNSKSSNGLSIDRDSDLPMEKAGLLWKQENLQEAINLYDRAIQENSNSVQAYEQLLSHLHQQNSVAEAYKKLATSLQKQGKNEEAATCYRQAIVIQAVTNEAEEKYQGTIVNSQIAHIPQIADLSNDAFSFQGSIKKDELADKPNLLQIELPAEYNPPSLPASDNKQLDSHKMATVEWETAQTFMQKALDYCDREEWSEVAKACQQATQIMPEMAEAYKIWGNALQRMNRTSEAMECYGKAVEIQPDLAEVYAGIAQLYAQQQKWQSATDYYQKAIIIKPDFARAYRSLAHVCEQSGELEKAQVCHHRATALEAKTPSITDTEVNPQSNSTVIESEELSKITNSSVVSYHKLAQDSEKQNLWHEAAVYYRKALELNLSQTQALVSGKLSAKDQNHNNIQLNRLKKIQELIKTQGITKETLTINHTNETLAPIKDSIPSNNQHQEQNTKNTIDQTKTPLDMAIGAYHKKAKLQPNSISIQMDLGDLYAKKGKWQSALTCYSKAIRINSHAAEAHLKLAKILGKTGNHSSYVEHMYLAYTIKPDLGSADDHFLLGEALKKLGYRNKAIACFEQAIKLQPHFTDAYRSLAQVWQEIGKPKNALSCYQAAIRHNPQDVDFHFNLGELLEHENAWEEAVKAYRKVLELQPKYPQASQKLNHALSKKLQQDLAVRYKR